MCGAYSFGSLVIIFQGHRYIYFFWSSYMMDYCMLDEVYGSVKGSEVTSGCGAGLVRTETCLSLGIAG